MDGTVGKCVRRKLLEHLKIGVEAELGQLCRDRISCVGMPGAGSAKGEGFIHRICC